MKGLFPASRSQMAKPFYLATHALIEAGIEVDVIQFSRANALPRRPTRALRAIQQDARIIAAMRSAQHQFFIAEPGVYFFRPELLRRHLRIVHNSGMVMYLHWRNCGWILENIRHQVGSQSFDSSLELMSQCGARHLAVSRINGEKLRDRFGIQSCATLSNCVESAPGPHAPPSDEPPLIVNAASVQLRKGPELFVEVAAKVCSKHPTVEFVWLGGIPNQDFMNMISAYGLHERVRFVAWTRDVGAWLQRSSGLLLTSRSEAFGLIAAEAMSVGRTVFTFTGTGPAEICGSTGVVVERSNLSQLADSILAHLERPVEARANEAALQRCLEEYSPTAFARRLQDILSTHS